MPKQHCLIKKENSLELTMEPAPPKKRPRKKIKAVWPDEQVKKLRQEAAHGVCLNIAGSNLR